jgi:hypothetical protein
VYNLVRLSRIRLHVATSLAALADQPQPASAAAISAGAHSSSGGTGQAGSTTEDPHAGPSMWPSVLCYQFVAGSLAIPKSECIQQLLVWQSKCRPCCRWSATQCAHAAASCAHISCTQGLAPTGDRPVRVGTDTARSCFPAPDAGGEPSPIAIAEVAAHGRQLPALTQPEVLHLMMRALQVSTCVFVWRGASACRGPLSAAMDEVVHYATLRLCWRQTAPCI